MRTFSIFFSLSLTCFLDFFWICYIRGYRFVFLFFSFFPWGGGRGRGELTKPRICHVLSFLLSLFSYPFCSASQAPLGGEAYSFQVDQGDEA